MSPPDPPQPLDYRGRPAVPRAPGSLLVVGWALATLVFGLIAAVSWPPPLNGSHVAPRAKCESNLHQIGLAILLYQQDNGGQYPETFNQLLRDEQIGPEVFVCPDSTDTSAPGTTVDARAAALTAGGHLSYVYLGRGLNQQTVTPTTIVAYEPVTNHGNGGNVLFGDGHAEWETAATIAKITAKAATTRPVTLP